MPPLKLLATHPLTPSVTLLLARGSVLDFVPREVHVSLSAIVNAANPSCLGGGGVDGAISQAGGPRLAADRRRLPLQSPVVASSSEEAEEEEEYGKIRCPTGSAVLTGPNQYGSLRTPYVIHAVGPDYRNFAGSASEPLDDNDDDDGYGVEYYGGDANFGAHRRPVEAGHLLLQSAYTRSLDLAASHGLRQVAFPLLSAGVYRAYVPLDRILELAVTAIADWSRGDSRGAAAHRRLAQTPEQSRDPLEVVLCAYAPDEVRALVRAGHRVLAPELPAADATGMEAKAAERDRRTSSRLPPQPPTAATAFRTNDSSPSSSWKKSTLAEL